MKITMKDLLDAGTHFGHRARYWNPRMRKYIYGTYNNIHIINLEKTVKQLGQACEKVYDIAYNRNKILFVGTKKTARELIRKNAQSINQCYVNHRWMGGMLTNYKTVSASIEKLKELEKQDRDGSLKQFTKKEAMMRRREMIKLERNIGGIRDMGGLPDALFIIDIKHEHIAAAEAAKLGIPVIAVVDTNSDPTQADYVIPGNDDSVKAIELYLTAIIDSFKRGTKLADETSVSPGEQKMSAPAVEMSDQAQEPSKQEMPPRQKMAGMRLTKHPDSGQQSKAPQQAPPPQASPASQPQDSNQDSNTDAASIKRLREITGAGILDCKKALTETANDIEKAVEQLRIAGKVKALKKADREARQGLIALKVDANRGTLARVNCETDFVARNADMQSLAETLVDAAQVKQYATPEDLFAEDTQAEKLFLDTRQKMGENILAAPFLHLSVEKGGCIAGYLHTNHQIAAVVTLDKQEPDLCYDLAMQVAAMSPKSVSTEDVAPDILAKEKEIYMQQIKDEDKSEAIKDKMVAGRLKKYAEEVALSEQASIKNPKQKIGDLLKAAGIQKVAFIRCEIGQADIQAGSTK